MDIKPPEKLQVLMYALGKEAARDSFREFLEYWEITDEEYAEIKAFMSQLGVKTYC